MKEAKRANDISQRQFDSSITSGNEADKRANEALEIQRQSAQAQIDALNETRKDYKGKYTPIVQMSALKIDSLEVGQHPTIKADILNVGNSPATIIYTTAMAVRFLPTNKSEEIRKVPYGKRGYRNATIDVETTFLPDGIILDSVWKKTTLDSVKSNELSVFVKGEIKYESPITGNKYLKIYIYEINRFPAQFVYTLKDTIVNIP